MLSDFMQKKMLMMFDLLDYNKTGYLDKNDFDEAFEKLIQIAEIDRTDSRYSEIRNSFNKRWALIEKYSDENKDGQVSKEEWLKYCDTLLNDNTLYMKHITGIAMMIFEVLGSDQKGQLTQEGLAKFYEAYGIDPGIAEFVFPNFDLDLDGFIDIQELKFFFDQFHTSEEPHDAGNQFFGDISNYL